MADAEEASAAYFDEMARRVESLGKGLGGDDDPLLQLARRVEALGEGWGGDEDSSRDDQLREIDEVLLGLGGAPVGLPKRQSSFSHLLGPGASAAYGMLA